MKGNISFQDRSGHRQEEYDTTNPTSMEKIKKMIRDKLKDGYVLYGTSKGGDFHMLEGEDALDDPQLDRFLITEGRKTVAPPAQAG